MDRLPQLIGASPAILAVKERLGRLLGRQSDRSRLPPVLVQGETGTGKGLLARAIHEASLRSEGPFVDVNCAAIPETLLEAEMFGFERGAFTDARQPKAGLFQAAHRGTIFLDEVGLLPEALQAKLLKVIEERAVRRLGSTRTEPVDIWLLTATNEDLVAATRARRFREDLYHRLAVVTVTLPPLRERGEDVLLLAERYLARACADYDLPARTLTPDARAALSAYRWPGNIRELVNVMERVALFSEDRRVTAEMLGLEPPAPPPETPRSGSLPERRRLEEAVGEVEREQLASALAETAWNITRAAARLGISRDTLRYRIAKHGLRPGPAAARRAGRPRVAPPPAALPAATAAPAPGATRWERRRLTLLRAAVTTAPGTDPRLYPSRALESVVEKVQSFGGRVEERGPTGLVAAFGLDAIEDAPRHAAHAAMAIQKAAQRLPAANGAALPIRVGIHVGQVLVGQGTGPGQIDLDGKRQAWTVLEALVAGAEPGAIVVSEAARPFLERHFELARTGGGDATAPPAYRLAGGDRGSPLGRRLAAFVGRTHDLDLLQNRLALALRGHGQVVAVVGEAGMGKSRLVAEFRRRLDDARVTCLQGRCQSYGVATPYLPILDILRQNFRLTELDEPETVAQKIRAGLDQVAMDTREWAPYLLHLFGVKEGTESLAALSPGAIKARTLEALRQMGLNGSRRRPIVFVVEDLQWVDPTSEECLAALMESMRAAPALVVVTYRPGYRPPWLDRSYVTQVALQPISQEDGLSLVRSVLGRHEVPGPLARVILERAEGNPFFIEELSRAVAQTGEVEPPGAVPETIEDVLLARLGRLPDGPRRLLQAASVLGRQAPLPLLRALWDGPGPLEPHLQELTRLEFLYPQTGGTEPVYAFVHTLTQEVAYQSLAPAARQALHAAAGRAFEAAHAGRLEEVYDRLGHHYSRAGQADKALDYLTRLAERAARAHAHTEAVRILAEALRHVEGLPAASRDRPRLELLLRQAYSMIPLGRFRDIVDVLLAHQRALEQVDDPALSGPFYFLLGRSQMFLGEGEAAAASAARAIAEATRCGDHGTLGKVYYVLAQQGALAGRMPEGIEYGRRAVELLERTGEQWWIGPAYWATGLNHALRGEFDLAREAEARATAIAQEVGDPELQSCAAWATGVVQAASGQAEAGVETCTRALERAPDPLNSAIAAGWLGFAHLEAGAPEPAIPTLERSVELLGQFRFPQLEGQFTVFLAEAHRMTGRPEVARALGRRGLELCRRSNAPYGTGCAERALGRLASADGDARAAEGHFAEALRRFAEIGARYDLARTHADLGALAGGLKDAEGAARHLADAARIFRALGLAPHLQRLRAMAERLGLPDPTAPGPDPA